MGILSKRSVYAINPIEEEDRVADELSREGKQVIKLNRGDPAVYFKTPKYMIDAYVRALKEGKTGYSDPRGIRELREAVALSYRRKNNVNTDAEHVIVTQGLSEAISMVNSALINEGDRAVLFRPSYPLYRQYLKICGGVEIDGRYDESNRWSIDVDSVAKALRRSPKGKKPKYLLVTNPNNPTGTVLDRKVLGEIVDLANEHGVLLIGDEIYDELVFGGVRFTSLCELAEGVPHIIMNGASKDFDATGFRLGFLLMPEDDKVSKEVREKIRDFATLRLSSNTPAQYAFAEGLNNSSAHAKALRPMLRQIEDRVSFATRLINESGYMKTVRPGGAYYIFPRIDLSGTDLRSDKEFVDRLLKEEHVQLTRGSGFGENGHIRIVALPGKNIIKSAIDNMNLFCKRHST
ncbi:Aromatic-amino-acid aminotransferase 2 [uncultured archaeon]|nr:Aromatic-amino-acid aminotransferase 2 [uncultured archaeon]